MERNIKRIKTFVLEVHIDEPSDVVEHLYNNIVFIDGTKPTEIPFDRLTKVERYGNLVVLKGHYTTQELFDRMYISLAGKALNSPQLAMLSKQSRMTYTEVWNRAYKNYPEILI